MKPRALEALGLSPRSLAPSDLKRPTLRVDLRSILVSKIQPDPDQPRTVFDDQSIDELAASIREHGLLQPIRVRQNEGGGFTIVAGERRWRAVQRIPRDEIDAIVLDERAGADEHRIQAIVENLHREDLNALDHANAFRKMIDIWKCSQAEAARRLSVSPAHVSRLLRLLELPEDVKAKIRSGELNYHDALKDREEAAAPASTTTRKPRKPPEVPRGTLPTPFGTVKLKRGAKLEELVGFLVDMVEKRKGAA